MKDVLALAELQFSRSRSWMPFAPGSRSREVMLYQAVFLLISLWFFRDWSDLGRLYAQWTIFHLFAVIIFSGRLWSNPAEDEWWLTIPRPRMHLVMGEALGYLRMGLHLAIYMEATVVLHYATALFLHWVPGISVSQFAGVAVTFTLLDPDSVTVGKRVRQFGVAVTFTLLDLAALVPAVGIGMFRVVFSRGWARVGELIYFILLFGLFTGWHVFNRLWQGAVPLSTIWMITLGIAVIGWPLSWFLVRLAAGVGLRRLGDMRLAESGWGLWSRTPEELTGTGGIRASRFPFWSLFELERGQYRFWGPGAPPLYRWLFGAAMAGVAVAGYVMMWKPESMFQECAFIGVMVYFFSMSRATGFLTKPFSQGWGSWWLAIPRPRWVLLAGRWLAPWTAMVEIMFLVLISVGVGFTIHGAVGGSAASVAAAWEIVGEIWLYFPLLFTVSFLLLQITPALFRSRPWDLLLAPIYAFGWVAPGWLTWISGRWMDPRQGLGFGHGIGLLAGIGIPLGFLCFWIGSRSLNRLIDVEDVWHRVERLRRKSG
ncbi:hypothetical protein [Kyrpidia tusciae]|uniref:Uncharacterized protein n=1 Tax=Kyrpidia tusciae (strain DSM 2912 / NBRC 15312 / T2) TaxID=562970 RepID=D5WSD8_KYRT2|nr:hypothetical protein [Kyrpidia tusciae]ADG05023.1 hypothetical protein Btus_0246 [Kyrpidia tusciae DSM 2912]